MNKIFRRLFIGIIFLGGVVLLTLKLSSHSFFGKECPFCDQEILVYQTFYEDDLVLALYTHRPVFPGHSLVIPKRHVERFEDLSDAEIQQIGRVIKEVNLAVEKVFRTTSYLLLQKNGLEVGQTVPHLHFHYIPRKAGDDSSVKFIFNLFFANVRSPINANEMHEVVKKMQSAMES